MPRLLKLAFRNLRRNWVRTLITVLGITGGLALVTFANNMNNGMYRELIRTGVANTAGHVVVQGLGYQKDPDIDRLMPGAAAIGETVTGLFPGERVVTRLVIQGILQSPQNSVGVVVNAIEPSKERRVSDFHEKVVEGEWLSDDDQRGIVLGAKLAESLQVGVGKKVVLMGQGKDDVSSRLFRVRGLIRSGSDAIDGGFAVTTLAAAQDFLGLPDHAAQVALHLDDPAGTEAALVSIRAALEGTPGLEILPWQEAVPGVYGFTVQDQKTNNLTMFMIGIIVAIGVLNTVLMSVLERTREFGVLLALGMRGVELSKLVALEGFILGLGASALGLLIAGVLTVWTSKTGIDLTAMMGAEGMEVEGVSIAAIVYPAIDLSWMAIYGAVGVLLTTGASIYPAWKVARLQPVEAMRSV